VLAVKSHPLLLVWLKDRNDCQWCVSIFSPWIQAWLRVRMLWHSTSNFSGYIPDFGRLLSRLESGCLLKCHNRAPYAYVITVPYFVYQCLILLLTDYIVLAVMCNHTPILRQPKKQRDRLHYWSIQNVSYWPGRRKWWSLTRYLHYASLMYELFIQPDEAYKIAICGNSLQHIRINRCCRYLALPIPAWKTCMCAKEYGNRH